jgi:hypothetical protein
MHSIGKVKLLRLVVHFDEDVQDIDIDLGAVLFRKDDRQYALDTVSVLRQGTRVSCTLERNDEVFEELFGELKYDLTDDDLLQGCDIEAYVQADEPIQAIELVARLGSMTIIIPVKQEQ